MSKQKKVKEYKVYGDGTKGLKNFFSLLSFFKPYMPLVVLAIILSVIPVAIGVAIPIFSAKFIAALTSSDLINILIYGGVTMGGQVLTQLIWWLNDTCILNKLVYRTNLDLRMKMMQKTLNLKMQNFDKSNTGFFMSIVQGSSSRFSSSLIEIVDYILDIASRIFYMGFALFINVWLGIYIIVACVIIFVFRYYRTQWNIKQQKIIREKSDVTSSFMNESLRGIRDIKYSKMENEVYDKNYELQEETNKLDAKRDRKIHALMRASNILRNVLQFGFIVLLVYLLYLNQIDPVIALTVYNFYGRAVSLSFTIDNFVMRLKDTEYHSYRINQVLSGNKYGFEEFGDSQIDMGKKKDVQFKNVTFAYEEEEVLKNISFKIKENTTVGIAGESGAGKSTIIRLLSKMYDVNEGEVIVAGSNIKDLSRESIRKLITVVPQDPYVFNMTFRENLTIVKPDATEEEIIDAFTKAQLYDFISSQKDGLDTKLGENGIVLSGGQKQRLAIARGLLIASPILILDEATSSLDNENQEKIKQVIASLSGSRTVIIIAHRLSTIIDADEILFIKNGKVAKRGTHKYLMENCKDYNNFYKSES